MRIIHKLKIGEVCFHYFIMGVLLIFSSCSRTEGPDHPNIILILTDDLGYNDLGCYNSRDAAIQTPNIDRLAAEGMRFTDWQSANSVCAPSRAAILTGRYPPRNGMVVVSHPFEKEQHEHLGLYQDQITIPELLKPLGYVSAAFGKWHMGEHYDYRPLRHGFDHYYGNLHNFAVGAKKDICIGDSMSQDSLFFENIHSELTNRAKAFMHKATNDNQPFFLYLSHYLVHGPWEPSKEFCTDEEWEARMKHKGGINQIVYPAMLRELDWHIGEIVNATEQMGISDNTIVFFTSDNGPWLTNDESRSAGSAFPLRGSKFNTFEGGHRVPGIVKYPQHIPAGQVSNELVSSMDIFASIADVTGAEMPSDYKIDGKSIWPLLVQEKGAKSPHIVLLAYHGKNLQTIRKGKWKLHLTRSPGAVPFYGQKSWGRGTLDSLHVPLLFNLEEDLEEQHDVSKMHPEVMEELLQEAEKARKELGDWNTIGEEEHHYNGFEGDLHAFPERTRKQ